MGNLRFHDRCLSAAKALRKSLGGNGMAMDENPQQQQPGKGSRGIGSTIDLRAMYDRVIRLTAENKISKNNAWDLDIIFHMPSIIRYELGMRRVVRIPVNLSCRCLVVRAHERAFRIPERPFKSVFRGGPCCRDYGGVEQQFNFQRASCGLDAGVNIYSKRVDSVYETCKEALFGFKGLKGDAAADGSGEWLRWGWARSRGRGRGPERGWLLQLGFHASP